MRVCRVFHGQATMQEFIGFLVRAGEVAERIVFLREKPCGAEHDAVQSVFGMILATQRFGGELGGAIDVAGCQRSRGFIKPDGGIACFIADVLGDHQRCGGGEDKPCVPGSSCRGQQVAGAGDVDIGEVLGWMRGDIRLVQGCGVDHRLNLMVCEGRHDNRVIGDRPDDVGVWTGGQVQPDHAMAGSTQAGREGAAELSGCAGQEDPHALGPSVGFADAEVEQMLLDSITHAKDDMQTRALTEARTEGEQLLKTTERFIQKNSMYLTASELSETAAAMQALQLSLTMNDKDLVQQKTTALNDLSRPYAERIMDLAISEAMKGKQV